MAASKEMSPLTSPFFPNIFFTNQFIAKPPKLDPNTDLSQRVAIITGGNSGLGLECARQLLSLNLSRVVLAVRSLEKGEAAAAKLRAQYRKASVEVWKLDMASYESIQAFVTRIRHELPRLDIAILNAGVMGRKFNVVSSTGHEEVFQINYLSTVFLAILLLPILKQKSPPGSPGRLSIVNAALSLTAQFPNCQASPLIPSFDVPETFVGGERYKCSKLLAHMFIWRLADFVSADDVIVNLVDPAWVRGTELGRDFPRVLRTIISPLEALMTRSLAVGASTYVDAVVSKGKESHACFLMSWKVQPFAAMMYTPRGLEVMHTLWQETIKELDFADVQGVLNSMKTGSTGGTSKATTEMSLVLPRTDEEVRGIEEKDGKSSN